MSLISVTYILKVQRVAIFTVQILKFTLLIMVLFFATVPCPN